MILFNDFVACEKIEWGAADTETFTYIDGVKVSNDELKVLGKTKPQSFFREHASVRVWAWQFSDGTHFFVTNDFDEFINFLCEHKVKSVWFYNAKFDFAQIDYQLLTHKPAYNVRLDDDKKSTPWTFSSLHNDKGGRYSLKVWTPYKGKGRKNDRHTRTHGVTFYDFCNIFGGGLARLLKEFNVVDYDGNKIRKTRMDYQRADEFNLSESDFAYLNNDTKGLYHLIRIANDTLKDITGYEIAKAKPDIMTAGGLAKKMLLRFLYPTVREDKRRERFQDEHPLTLRQDKFFRETRLYNGGLCILNERYQGRLLTGVAMRRYDVNSEYPFVMSVMPDIYGIPQKMSLSLWNKQTDRFKKTHIAIYIFDELHGSLKPKKIPVFRNGYTGRYESDIDIDDGYYSLFENEFEELRNWYIFDFHIKTVIVYKTRQVTGYKDYVDYFYTLKNESKKTGDKAKTLFAKLLLNSSYGKLAERIVRSVTYREINPETGAVHLINTMNDETDENARLSLVQGAWVTSAARVWVLSHIREICNENVEKNLIYCDTDSIHTFCEYKNADAYALGGFKDESPNGGFNVAKYIAPKCYFDAVANGNNIEDIEFHSKGLNTQTIVDEFVDEMIIIGYDPDGAPIYDLKWKTLDLISKRFSYGEKFQPLSGMNIKGGKALIPIEKYLAKPIAGFNAANDGLYEP